MLWEEVPGRCGAAGLPGWKDYSNTADIPSAKRWRDAADTGEELAQYACSAFLYCVTLCASSVTRTARLCEHCTRLSSYKGAQS